MLKSLYIALYIYVFFKIVIRINIVIIKFIKNMFSKNILTIINNFGIEEVKPTNL